jgi:hypothetical protein
MLNNHRPTSAAPVNFKSLEFFTIQLSPLADGNVFVAMTATTVDDQDAQLLNQEIASDRVATIDDALALITERVRASSQHAATGKDG